MRVSYLEIYKEEVRDLLSKNHSTRLEVRERVDVGVYVKDLTSFVVKSPEEMDKLMFIGDKNSKNGEEEVWEEWGGGDLGGVERRRFGRSGEEVWEEWGGVGRRRFGRSGEEEVWEEWEEEREGGGVGGENRSYIVGEITPPTLKPPPSPFSLPPTLSPTFHSLPPPQGWSVLQT